MNKVISLSAFTVATLFSAAGMAANNNDMMTHGAVDHNHASMQGKAPLSLQMVDAQVKKIDKTAGKATLTHGPLENLGMPAMTMVFRVKESDWLNQMKEGDKIRFQADNVNGALTIVQFEPAKR